MRSPPERPKVYHITHVDSLEAIVKAGCLRCDRDMQSRGGPTRMIGNAGIKKRRMEELEVSCHPGTMVGDYVPFYFGPRSVMLYVIDRANHPELAYKGGQRPIIHLVADLRAVTKWADGVRRRWAFSLSNAGSFYAEFRSSLDDLGDLDWNAIRATDWSAVKERKQAEFLVHESFPFELVERIGVHSAAIATRVEAVLSSQKPRPPVEVLPSWYY